MLKVCYIHPSSSNLPNHWVMAAGIFGILDKIQKKGFEVEALDYPMEMYLDEYFSLEEWLSKNPADYYLVGLHWYIHAEGACEVVRKIRSTNKNAVIIVGGITSTLFHEFLMRDISDIDYMIVGDGEEPIPQLLEALAYNKPIDEIANIVYREDGNIVKSKYKYILKDFQGLVYSNYSFLHNKEQYPLFSYPGVMLEERSLWLETGRGCIYSCVGCGAARKAELGRNYYCEKGFLPRDVEDVIRDIDQLRGYHLDYIKLTHDLGSVSKEYYEKFFQYYKELHIETKIYNEFWQIPSEDFLNKAVESGLEGCMDYAITAFTGDEKLRKKLGKIYSNKELIQCLQACIASNFTVKLYFSRYLPDGNSGSLIQTLKLIQQIKKLDQNKHIIEIIYEGYLADPCSPMREDSSLEEDYDSYVNWNLGKKNQLYQEAVLSLDLKSQLLDNRIYDLVYGNGVDV